MILSNNFSYRYTEKRKVYAITIGYANHISNMPIYSVPHLSKEVQDTRNVLLGFTDEKLCLECVQQLKKNHEDLNIIKMDLTDFRHIGSMMSMPIAVILDKETDDVLNIYYNAN